MSSNRQPKALCSLWLAFVVLCSIGIARGDNVHQLDLNSNWTLTNQNQTIVKEKLKLPSGVFSALYGEKVLRSYNDVNMRWIAYDNWTYTKTFSINKADINSEDFINLTFFGIDTVAEIRFNHRLLGRVDNMFVYYTYDVTKMLEEENLIEVEISSPIYAALARARTLNVTVPPECPPERYHGECHMNMLRKMQASFGWDWGVAVPSMGIWKSVALEFYEVAIMRDIDVAIDRNETHWNMQATLFLDAYGHRDFFAEVTVFLVELYNSAIIMDDHKRQPISYKAPMARVMMAIPIERVTQWWPNGFGDQKLYPVLFSITTYLDRRGPHTTRKTTTEKAINVGFRTIELVEEPVREGQGNTFLFRVNGQEIFMKGTNYIPSHILPELSHDKERIRYLLESAAEAHMNMIRVWGGGIYESDYFYELADQFGILIWQDMMFACAMYPVSADFLASVSVEVRQNARRLSHHPSLAIFATNNENEVALAQNWYGTVADGERFRAEYRQLYLATVMHELKETEHSSRPRPLVSSPSNGQESAKDNFISDNPQSPDYGDVHFYSVFGNTLDANLYPRPRFASEYGFQSLPNLMTLLRSKNSKDDILELINHREHHPMGLMAILPSVQRHLPLPLPENDDYVEALIYMSQIMQALSTKTETELYRSLRDTNHRTMGALYWQLNDVWAAPSWSSIDFYGNYKILHYWARDFMAPIHIVALYDDSNKQVNLSLICDYSKVDTRDLQVTMNVYKWSSLHQNYNHSWPVTLKPNGVQYDKQVDMDIILNEDCNSKKCFAEFVLHQNATVLAKNYFFPNALKSTEGVMNPSLRIEIASGHCQNTPTGKVNSYSLTITVKRPALFIFIEFRHRLVKRYWLSKNGFLQISPIDMVHLEFKSDNCVNITRNHLAVQTLNQYFK